LRVVVLLRVQSRTCLENLVFQAIVTLLLISYSVIKFLKKSDHDLHGMMKNIKAKLEPKRNHSASKSKNVGNGGVNINERGRTCRFRFSNDFRYQRFCWDKESV